jgi:glycosyltransferase involved in cell wall biosynthesis
MVKGNPGRVLHVLSRPPGGEVYGRVILNRMVDRALRFCGYEVDVVHVSRSVAGVRSDSLIVPRPAPAAVVWNLVSGALLGRLSLSECLFFSHRGRAALKKMISQHGYSFILCDTLRVVELISGLGVPVVIDFDDLFSERYKRALRTRHLGVEVLGYVRDEFPVGGVAANVLVRALISIEIRLLNRREISLARSCSACSVTSRKEAAVLKQRAGRKVYVLPMAVELPDRSGSPSELAKSGAVFLGKMDYAPNADAMRYFVREVLPQIRALMPDFIVDVIGYCPEALRIELGRPGVRFLGFVADLNAALARYACMVAPIVSGSGTKSKVMDAMAAGLPVVGTRMAFEGLGVESGREGLVADSGPEMAVAVHLMQTDHALGRRIADAAQELVRREFEFSVIQARWGELVSEVLSKRQGKN